MANPPSHILCEGGAMVAWDAPPHSGAVENEREGTSFPPCLPGTERSVKSKEKMRAYIVCPPSVTWQTPRILCEGGAVVTWDAPPHAVTVENERERVAPSCAGA